MHHASPLCESQQQRAEVPPNGWARQSPTFCDSSARPSSISLYPKVVDPSFQIFDASFGLRRWHHGLGVTVVGGIIHRTDMHHASPLCESQQQRAEVPPNGWARQSPTFCDSSARPSSISLYPKVVDPSFQIFEFEYFDNSSDRHGRSSFSLPAIQLSLVSFQFVNGGVKMYRGLGGSLSCPSYKFRPAQKSGPFRVVPDSVCDPHTILRHGVLSNFRSRAMRQLEIIAPRHQRDVLGATSQASGWDTQNTRVSAPDGVYRRDRPVSGVSVAGVADIPAVPNAAASSSPSRAQCQTDLPPLAGSDHQHGRPAERADIGPRCTSSRLPSQKRSKATGGRVLLRPRLGNPAASVD